MKWLTVLILLGLTLFLREQPPRAATLPVQHEGRVKPLDTVARVTRILLHGKEGTNPSDWFLSLLFEPEKQRDQAFILSDHPDLFPERYVSFNTIQPRISQLYSQYQRVEKIPTNDRDAYEVALANIWKRVELYTRLVHSVKLYYPKPSLPYFNIAPPNDFDPTVKWQNRGENLHAWDEFILSWPKMDSNIDIYMSELEEKNPTLSRTLYLELFFNTLQPFFFAKIYYLIALVFFVLLTLFRKNLWCASGFMIAAFILHTLGILLRMTIEGRPPVTNLYSSALFVGWAGVLTSFLLMRKNSSFMLPIAGSIGFLTLSISSALNIQGETLEMMRAVLDSNFWLSSHVIAITLGYGAAFLAGFLAAYALLFSNDLKSAAALVYKIITLTLVLSFVGTLLGGIWADQSWGRFWGWDPKENGALMIVLWNSIIIHMRIAGFVQSVGFLRLAVFGNVITSFSWFGVNMLGIGLHSYGFIEQAFVWLLIFIIANLVIIAKPTNLSIIPSKLWKHK